MYFKQTAILPYSTGATTPITIESKIPLELEIDATNAVTENHKIYKIKYFLNETLFHTEILNPDEENGGDARSVKIFKKFLYNKLTPTPLNNKLEIHCYAMGVEYVWIYTIFLNLSYPVINNPDENIFFNTLKLIDTHILSEKDMIYIFECEKENLDSDTGAIEKEKNLLPVKIEWLEKEEIEKLSKQSDIIYDSCAYKIRDPITDQWFDTSLSYLITKTQAENKLTKDQDYYIENFTLRKRFKINNVENVKILDKTNLPNVFELQNLELNYFSYKKEHFFSANNASLNFVCKFYMQNSADLLLENGNIIYIPCSRKIKKIYPDVFNNKINPEDDGSLIEKTSGLKFRLQKLINKTLPQDLNLSEIEKIYIYDLYWLVPCN